MLTLKNDESNINKISIGEDVNIPENLKYTSSHEWVLQHDDGTVSIGITEHAQSLLGDVVFVELPDVDQQFSAGGECGVIESVKAAADLYCPIAGTVVDVNLSLADKPELINQQPYQEGWILKIRPESGGAIKTLLSAAEYEKQLAEEH